MQQTITLRAHVIGYRVICLAEYGQNTSVPSSPRYDSSRLDNRLRSVASSEHNGMTGGCQHVVAYVEQ